jgi:hypothetical protein
MYISYCGPRKISLWIVEIWYEWMSTHAILSCESPRCLGWMLSKNVYSIKESIHSLVSIRRLSSDSLLWVSLMLCMCSSAVLIASISSSEYHKLVASDFAGRSMKRTSVLLENCTRTARTALQKLLRLLGKSTMRLCVLGKSTMRPVVVLLRSISSLELLLSFDRLRDYGFVYRNPKVPNHH